jgi:23S rRNA pseudouridine1911/1915/1917 synthase
MSDQEKFEEEADELFEHHRIVCDPGQAVLRIDKFLVDRIPNTSRSRIQTAATSDFIKVNGSPVKPNYKVKPQDVITVELPYPVREIELIPQDIPIDIVYEDDHLLLLNKQAGIVVHPGYGNYSGTLINALIFHFQQASKKVGLGGEDRPGLVHRLDKNTTGLMVIAKTDHALTHLAAQFYNRTTKRSYVALVWGDVKEDGLVEAHVGRSLKNRKVMDVFPEGEHGKKAITHYKVLKKFGYVTLVQCKLETGRTHQIRVHMKSIGHPLFNDPEYGGNKILKGTTFTKYRQFIQNCFNLLPRQALHALSLGFEHPDTGDDMFFESEIPDDLRAVITKWEGYTIR